MHLVTNTGYTVIFVKIEYLKVVLTIILMIIFNSFYDIRYRTICSIIHKAAKPSLVNAVVLHLSFIADNLRHSEHAVTHLSSTRMLCQIPFPQRAAIFCIQSLQ